MAHSFEKGCLLHNTFKCQGLIEEGQILERGCISIDTVIALQIFMTLQKKMTLCHTQGSCPLGVAH